MRLFVAAYLDRDSMKKITHYQQTLKNKINAKFVKANQLHITLLFLGDQDETILESIESWFEQISKESFTISFEDVNIFRDTLILPLKNHSYLNSLHQSLKRCVNDFLKLSVKPFTPHITLARKVTNKNTPKIESMAFKHVKIKEIALVKSTLAKNGATHEKLKVLSLINH